MASSRIDKLAEHRLFSIEHDDFTWDAEEVRGLADLARTEDGFDRDGVRFMVKELESDTSFEPAARRQLFDVLVQEAKVDPRTLAKGAPPDVVLAMRAGGSDKFYTMAVEGAELTTRYGRIGTEGKAETKRFASAAEARREMMATLRSKLKKGYAPVAPEEIGLEARREAPAAFGLAQWHALPKEERARLVDGYAALPPGVTHVEVPFERLEDPRHVAFAEQMREAASNSTGGFEVHDDEYLLAGPPELSVGILAAADGAVLGGTFRAFQAGCETPDDYWDNEGAYDEAALKALADATDVSWQCQGHYAVGKDGGLETLKDPDYMEWSGY